MNKPYLVVYFYVRIHNNIIMCAYIIFGLVFINFLQQFGTLHNVTYTNIGTYTLLWVRSAAQRVL
jgi:voltage-gated potassium channel Kch